MRIRRGVRAALTGAVERSRSSDRPTDEMHRLGALAAGIAIAVPGRVSAQETPGLGPHGVGFRLIEARDSTRAFRAARMPLAGSADRRSAATGAPP